MSRQRLSTIYGRLLLLLASGLVTLACSTGEALATVPVSGPGGWQTGPFYVTVTDGYSYNNGASMSCSGSNGAYETYYGAGPDSGGVLMEQQWYVPNNGATTISCTVWNSNRTASDSGSGTFYMDNVTPSVGVNVSGGAGANGWYYSAPGFSAALYGYGPSGISSTGCSGIYQQGANSITCSATSGAGITGYGGTTIYYDSYTPYVNTSISGGSQQNGWYGTAPSITPSPYNVGPSGVWYDSCSGLSNGTNSVTCSVTDVNGLGSTNSPTTVRLDNQTPTNTMPSSTGSWYTSLASIPTLSLRAAEGTNYSGLTSISCTNPNNGAAGNYSVSQGVSASASLTGTYPTSDLAIGTNNISCTSSTGAGNTRTTPFTVLYDPQTPTAQISGSASSTTWYSSVGSIPGLSASGTVGSSGVKTFTCTGDGISSQSYANNTGGTVALSGLNEGPGTITCTLTANNGLSATATKVLQLDTVTPAVSYDTSITSTLWYSHGTLPDITVEGTTSGASGIDHLTCDGDGLPSGYTINGASGTLPAADLDQGAGQVTCSSTSVAGLTSSTQSLTVKIDDAVPVAQITSTASPTAWYSSTASIPTVSVAATAGPSGVGSIYCSAPGVNHAYATSSATVDLSSLRSGADTITCTPTSGSGVTGTPVTLPVNLDTQAPTLSFAGHTSQTAWYDTESDVPELDTDATAGPSGLSTIACSGDGITNQVAMFSGAPVNLQGLAQGTGTITCVATSGAGLSTTRTFTLNLDSSTPTAAWNTTESQTAWYAASASVPTLGLTATAGGPSGIDHVTCSGGALNGNLTVHGTTATIPASALANGSNTISCVPVSGAGVSGAPITRTIQLDNTAPGIALSGPDQNTWYADAQTVTADTSTDTNPSGIQSTSCSLDGGTPTVTSGGSATQNVNQDGVHTVTCQPVSGAGVEGQTATTKVRIDSQTPTVTQTVVPASPSAPPGTVNVQIAGAETNALSGIASTTCSLDNQTPTTVNGSQQTVAISTAGTHTLDCAAQTGAGTVSADSTQTYTVNADPSQFSLQYGAVATAWQSGPVAIPVSLGGATAALYQSMTCTVNDGTPTTITGTSGSVTISASGTDKLACYATAANGADTAAIQQLVRVDNQTPTAAWSTSPTSTGEKITLLGSEPTPLSGIASETCSIDGGASQTSSSSSLTVTVTGNGTHQLACAITTVAGVTANVTYTAHISLPVPAPTTVSAPDPGRWYRTAQSIVIGIPSSTPAVNSVVCSQNGTATTYPVAGTSVTIPVTAPGGNVQCYDIDTTGAQSASVSFQVNIDDQGPTGYFQQTGPVQAIVTASEPADGAGVQSVTVQYQTSGGQWTTIPGTYNSTSGQEVVTLPSALTVPGTEYSLQAIAVDNAGNSTVINTMQNGAAASSTVPNPDAGAQLTGGLYAGTVPPGARGRTLKTTRTHKRVHGTTRVVLHKRYVWEVNHANPVQQLTVSYGEAVSLTGSLTLPAGDAANQTVAITETSGPRTSHLTATTNSDGVFNVKIPMSGNRTVSYTVAGVTRTATIRQHGLVTLSAEPGSTRARLALAGAGGRVLYRLQVLRGGHWRALGRPRRTNTHGRAVVNLPAALAPTPLSHFRVVVATQPTWQYLNVKERA